MSLFINPYDTRLKEKIDSLRPTYGYCFFIDIVGSTELKDQQLSKWIIYIYNTFANIRSFLFSKFQPIKVLGDALMFFIPETEMKEETPLTFFNGLTNIINDESPYFKEVRIGAAFCRESYDITFKEGSCDIYGKDIDLTARLASLAGSREIVMNSEFVERLCAEYGSILNRDNFPEVAKINGPELEEIKGFRNKVEIFRLRR